MATLHHLAPELLILTLSSVGSLRDLHSLICASAPCFRAFSSNRTRILSSILENAIQPDALRHALAVGQIPSPLPVGSEASIVLAFLGEYFLTSEIEFPTDMARLVSICKVYNGVSRLIDDFSLRSAHLLGFHPPLSEDNALWPEGLKPSSYKFTPLSTTELTRLQRAFFRYEIYSRVFPPSPEHQLESLFSSENQFRLFLSRLEPWEVEEMSCIHTYFASLVAGFINDLEEQITQAVLTSPGVRCPARPFSSSPRRMRTNAMATRGGLWDDSFAPTRRQQTWKDRHTPQTTEAGEKLVFFTELDLRGLSLFEKQTKRRIPKFLSNMASLGLGFMIRLIDGNEKQRRDMIQERAPFSRDFLPEALEYSPSANPGVEITPPITDIDRPCSPNLGYFLFRLTRQRVYARIYDIHGKPVYEPLREMGYVFWDANRIKIPHVKEHLDNAKNAPRNGPFFCRWIREKSVEERLDGVLLPESEMERIEREYGRGYEDHAYYGDGSHGGIMAA